MDLSKIIAISGKSGLFKIISQTTNTYIIESLIDGKRTPAFPTQKISKLDEISVFTNSEDIPLVDVFKKIYEKYGENEIADIKSDDNKLKNFFNEVLPEYDKERVYTSDIKKIVNWYNLLQKNNLLEFKADDNNNVEETDNKEENKTDTTNNEEIKQD